MRKFLIILVLCLVPIVADSQTINTTQQLDNLLSNGDFSRGEDAWDVPSESAQAAVVDTQAGPFRRALRLSVNPLPNDPPYSIALRQSVGVALKKGQALTLQVWLRSTTGNQVDAIVEETAAPYAKSLSQTITLTPQWKEYELRGVSLGDYAAEGARVMFSLGYKPGTIEIAGVRFFAAGASRISMSSNATPDRPESLIANGDFSSPRTGNWESGDGPQLPSEIVPVDVAGHKQALRLTLNPAPDANPWSLQIGQKVNLAVARDDAVYFRAWMRSPDRVRVGLIYELARDPHTKSISQTVQLTPDWKEYRFVGYAERSFAPGESQVRLHLGHDKGVLEMTGVRVENYGKAPKSMFQQTIDYWGGAQPSDDWRAAALARIQKIRKGDVKIRVLDAVGNPVPGATVQIEQKYHHFRFGTAAPVSRLLDKNNPDSLRFQQEVRRLYNTITFENDLKWSDTMEQNVKRVEQVLPWLYRNGAVNIRGHNFLWGSKQYMPASTHNLSREELLKVSREHVYSLGQRLRGKVYLWDVVNEAATNTWLWDTIGWENFANAYKWAREADPNALLCYNDYDIINEAPNKGAQRVKVRQRIQYLLDHGAPLDVIGIQGHIGIPLTPVSRVLEILDEMAAYGKPIEITEFDVGVQDDAIHGQYVRDSMIAFFSHPALQGFIMWGFWEGAHWRARDGGAMFRKDWSKRPAQVAYEDLVFNQWWTRTALTTAPDGATTTRAFYGLHTVTVEKDGNRTRQTLQLLPGGSGDLEIKLGR